MQVFDKPDFVTWERKLREIVRTGEPLSIREDKYHGIYRKRKKIEKELGVKIECKKVKEGILELSIANHADDHSL